MWSKQTVFDSWNVIVNIAKRIFSTEIVTMDKNTTRRGWFRSLRSDPKNRPECNICFHIYTKARRDFVKKRSLGRFYIKNILFYMKVWCSPADENQLIAHAACLLIKRRFFNFKFYFFTVVHAEASSLSKNCAFLTISVRTIKIYTLWRPKKLWWKWRLSRMRTFIAKETRLIAVDSF